MSPALLLLALQAAPGAPPPAAAAPAATPTPPVLPPATQAPTATPVVPPAPVAPPQPYNDPAGPAPTTAPPPAIQPLNYPLPDARPEPAAIPDAIKYRRLVFANFNVLNFGVLFPVPSGDFQFFLGTNLRPRKSRHPGSDWNTAIGYQLTLSVGYADGSNYIAAPYADDVDNDASLFGRYRLLTHRHALMAMGHGGRRGRLFYALGGGALMWATDLVGIEGEGKLGYVFSAREGRRLKGVLGGQVRLTGFFGGVPLPQFGLFIGFMVF